jgi:quinolinate synthase
MNETTLQDLYNTLKSIENKSFMNEVIVDEEVAKWAKIALERMFKI